jgi:tetratricopeptide (TPR) repeat protein
MSDSTFKKTVAVLIAIITVAATLIAFLQSDASNRDDRAGRDATRLAIELVGRRVNGEAQVNFDYDEAYQKYLEMDALSRAALNHGDERASERYGLLKQSFIKLSPIMQAPYFDAETENVDLNRYIADVYLTDVTRMNQEYTAAAAVKDAWDTKSNTYIVHLTILAVSLFLLGLSTTIEVRAPRMIFTVVGIAMAGVAAVWALSTYLEPVFDLRDKPEAIEAFVQGTILSTEGDTEGAKQAFDAAIAAVPDYAAAYVGRSLLAENSGDYEPAIADLKQARSLGVETASVIGEQAWMEYLVGRFDESIATGRQALELYPNAQELWIRFDLGLALLAKGDIDAAKAEYNAGMQIAIDTVAEAQRNGQPVSSLLWWSLTAGSDDVVTLGTIADGGEGAPPADALQNKEGILAAAPDLIDGLRNLAVSLEFYGRPPGEPITADITNLEFAEPVYSEDAEFVEHDVATEFDFGVNEMDALFDYAGMEDGQELLVKVYINGEEDASWRKAVTWEGGEEGSYILPLAIAYSDTFVMVAGNYFVEVYLDGQIAAEGGFIVNEPDE